jgi:hypothetical protein
MAKRSLLKAARGMIMTGILAVLCLGPAKAQGESDPFYWIQDTTLLSRLDTVPLEQVIAELNKGLDRIVAFLSTTPSLLLIDSITSWNQIIRQAVILKNPGSEHLIDTIACVASQGDRGHWQYYFVYMTLWASYLNATDSFSTGEKALYVLGRIDTQNQDHKIFYEDRLLDMGPAVLPTVISWARENIIPEMNPPDKQMLSEEDLEHYNSYHHFIDLVNMLVKKDEEQKLFRDLLMEKDPEVQRFARDVLGID